MVLGSLSKWVEARCSLHGTAEKSTTWETILNQYGDRRLKNKNRKNQNKNKQKHPEMTSPVRLSAYMLKDKVYGVCYRNRTLSAHFWLLPGKPDSCNLPLECDLISPPNCLLPEHSALISPPAQSLRLLCLPPSEAAHVAAGKSLLSPRLSPAACTLHLGTSCLLRDSTAPTCLLTLPSCPGTCGLLHPHLRSHPARVLVALELFSCSAVVESRW